MIAQVSSILSLGLLLVSQAGAQQVYSAMQETTVKIYKHTGLRFATVQSLDSANAKIGDDVPMRLLDPLVVDGITVFEAGEVVHGEVTKVRKADSRCHNGLVRFKLDHVAFPDLSIIRTKVRSVDSTPDAYVPTVYLQDSPHFDLGDPDIPTDTWWKAVLGVPVLGVKAAVYAPLLVPALVLSPAYLAHGPCSDIGREYHLAANATVGVEITNDYELAVSYE